MNFYFLYFLAKLRVCVCVYNFFFLPLKASVIWQLDRVYGRVSYEIVFLSHLMGDGREQNVGTLILLWWARPGF